MLGKFHELPTRFLDDLALFVNSIFSEMRISFRTGSDEPEMLQGWFLIERTMNFIIKKIKRDNSCKIFKCRKLKFKKFKLTEVP